MFTTNKSPTKTTSELNVGNRIAEIKQRLASKRNDVASKLATALMAEVAA